MEGHIHNLVAFIQNEIKGNIKDYDYLNLMMLVSKIHLENQKEIRCESDEDESTSYNDEYIGSYT